jgi:hypothetical protein
LATCRRPVPRSSLRRPDKRCSFGAQRNEAVEPAGVLGWVACAALLINALSPAAACVGAVRCERRRYETEFAVCGARIDLGFFDARGPLGAGRPQPSSPLTTPSAKTPMAY